MKGGDVATCTTFHMGKGRVYQCKDRSGRQLIEKEKKSWLLGTSDQQQKKEDVKEEEQGKRR